MIPNQEAPSELDRIISDYLLATETGEELTVDGLCQSHPEHAPGIRQFFNQSDRLILCLETANGAEQLQIAGYEILREIGRGGMGVVFEARQLSLGRNVAIKVLRDGPLSSDQARARFDSEARLIARMKHDSIVSVLEFGQVDGRPFLVMPLVDGTSLNHVIRNEPFGEKTAAKVMVRVADAIEYAHGQGVIHRDIKPANIVGDPANCQVMDFGLAILEETDERLSRSGDILGTPGYQAPEILRGKSRGDVATDIYSMGATLYALLIGQAPHMAATAAESMLLAMQGDPVAPRQVNSTLSTDINSITLKCLHSNPARRYGSARELREDLQNLIDGRPVAARPVSTLERVRRWASRNMLLATAIVTTALLAVGLLVGGVYSYRTIADSLEKQGQLTKASNSSLRGSISAVRNFYSKVGSAGAFDDTEATIALRKELLIDGVAFLNGFLQENNNHPDLQLEIANTHMLLSELYDGLGDSSHEKDSAMAAETVFSQLHADDESIEVVEGYARCLMAVADSHMRSGDFEAAEMCYKRATGISEPLAELEETQPESAILYYQSQFAVFRSMEKRGERNESLVGGAPLLPEFDRIVEANPSNSRLLFLGAQTYGWFGVMDHRSGPVPGCDKKQADIYYTRGYDLAIAAAALDPGNEEYERQAAGCAGNLVYYASDGAKKAPSPEIYEKQLAVEAIFQKHADRHPGNLRRQVELLKAKEHTVVLAVKLKRSDARDLGLKGLGEVDALLDEIPFESNPASWGSLHGIKLAMLKALSDRAGQHGDFEEQASCLQAQIADLRLQIEKMPEDRRLIRHVARDTWALAKVYGSELERQSECWLALDQAIDAWLQHGLHTRANLTSLRHVCWFATEQFPLGQEWPGELLEATRKAVQLIEQRKPALYGDEKVSYPDLIGQIKEVLEEAVAMQAD